MKAHVGILGTEADVLAKRAVGAVPPDGNEKWMSGGGIRQWTKAKTRK